MFPLIIICCHQNKSTPGDTASIINSVIMKASQTWKKLKLARKLGLKANEDKEKDEKVEKDVLYEIHRLQEPNYKNKITKNQDSLGCLINFADSFMNEIVDIPPDPSIADKFKIVPPLEKRSGGNKTLAHSDCNTDNKVLKY